MDETASGQLNVRRLASLVRIYGMLCACASTVEERTENALLARHYALRMWQTSMAEVNRIDSADAHKAALAAAPAVIPAAVAVPVPAAKSSSSKDKDKIEAPPPPPLLNRYPLPQSDEEWAAFQLRYARAVQRYCDGRPNHGDGFRNHYLLFHDKNIIEIRRQYEQIRKSPCFREKLVNILVSSLFHSHCCHRMILGPPLSAMR